MTASWTGDKPGQARLYQDLIYDQSVFQTESEEGWEDTNAALRYIHQSMKAHVNG